MKKINLTEILNLKKFLFENYHLKSKIKSIPKKEINSKYWPEAWKKIYFKAYPRFDAIKLPRPKLSNKISFTETLINRRSRRNFSFRKLSINELSALLYFTAGIKEDGSRFYPSGGGRYPLELYLISLETELKRGLYHYYSPNHVLEKLIEIKELNFENIFTPYNQTWVKDAAIIFLVSAIFSRSAIKYGERAYRLILIEAGHLGQNFYLVSEALGLNCCAIAGINDVYIEKMLDIDGVKESLIYACAFG